MKQVWQRFRGWWGWKSRYVRLKLAGRVVRVLGCTTVEGQLVLQVAKKLAELDSYIEKSSEIQHRKHAYAQLVSRIREVEQMLEGAVRLGDPNTDVTQFVQVFQQARWLSMSRNQQRKYQKAATAQQVAQLPPKPPQATAVKASA